MSREAVAAEELWELAPARADLLVLVNILLCVTLSAQHCTMYLPAELREQQRRDLSRPSSVSPVLGDVGVAAAPVDPYLSPGDGGNASDDLDDGCEDEDDDGGITTPGAARRHPRRVRWE